MHHAGTDEDDVFSLLSTGYLNRRKVIPISPIGEIFISKFSSHLDIRQFFRRMKPFVPYH